MKWTAALIFVLCVLGLVLADGTDTVNTRVEKRDNNGAAEQCRYTKGPWSECDSNNTRTRTLSLKRGDSSVCQRVKVIQKKCKKRGCRYDRAMWGPCKENGEMTRVDPLKPISDAGCEPTRVMTKKCNRNKVLGKDKGTRRNRQ